MYQNQNTTNNSTISPPTSVHALAQQVQQLQAQLATVSPAPGQLPWNKAKGKGQGQGQKQGQGFFHHHLQCNTIHTTHHQYVYSIRHQYYSMDMCILYHRNEQPEHLALQTSCMPRPSPRPHLPYFTHQPTKRQHHYYLRRQPEYQHDAGYVLCKTTLHRQNMDTAHRSKYRSQRHRAPREQSTR